MSDLVTGDAVVVELRLARLASRALAFAIDLALMATAFLLLILLAAATGTFATVDDAFVATVVLVVTLAVFVAYPVTMETLTRGRSLGKIALGLRVVREDGGPIRFRHALARGLAGFAVDFGVLSLFTGTIGLISSLASAQGRRVGDMLAGTVVVRERVPVARAAEVLMPPQLAGWAASLALSQLPDAPALSARQFLQRVGDLDPQVRVSLGAALAGQVAAHVSPAPPTGTPAEAYLAAVLAERRRREEVRLAAQQPAAPPMSGHQQRPDPPQPIGQQQEGFRPTPSSPTGTLRDTDPQPDGFAVPR
ncbi:MAG: RDD family protein [Pseudonocardia sp.]